MAEFTSFKPCSGKIRCLDFKYHVFLSFRGPDVRKSFVDHLVRALTGINIHVFLDTEKLHKGEIIGLSLEKGIENSAIRVPIFSSGYADSPWCLEEVRHMWKCRSTGLIVPLFYDVNPSDVRYPLKKEGKYAEAFNKHYSKANLPDRFKSDIIDEWKAALHYVASLSGWSLHMVAGYEARLVEQVVSDINALNFVPRSVPQNVVGLEHHVRRIKQMLALHLIDRTIGVCIWGIGGIGKTTLSNAIFNEVSCNFQASCFLSDIRGAQDHGGIIGLQTQILKDLPKVDVKVNDIDHGKALLQFHLRSVRSLIVLDNIDHRRQLENFRLDCCGAGSRIIITTRDCGSLNISLPPENIYELQGLQQDESLKLFSLHAFHKAQPDDSHRNLSIKIVKASGGVPLTLEVLGAFLANKKTSDKSWTEALRMLKNLKYQEIFQSLKISYDSLLPWEKEIFLDIACYFVGQDTEEPTIFWEELGFDVDTALHDLKQKLLIKIGKDNKFTMHDVLRDLGRAIVADEYPGNPGKRSRLWKQEDVQKVINEKRGTENVKYLLHAQEIEGTRLKKKSLASMNGLRYLCFNDTILKEGDTSKLSPDLKWFKWKRCSLDVLPPQWNLEHLAILDVSSRSISNDTGIQSSLNQLWNEQSYRKMPKNLRVLRVNWCPNLQRLPALSTQKSLFKLDLTGCSLITELPDSLGFQAQLYYLELSGCSRLEKLPERIGNLLELEYLGLAECSSLKALPYSIGYLQKLLYLNLFQCRNLEQLPSTITRLSCLQKIVLSNCSSLKELPDNLEGLRSLKTLELRDVFDIQYLPRSIGSLSRLEKLDLESCLIVTLPPPVGHLKHLRCLNMNSCEFLCIIPDEIGGLESLEEFLLNNCVHLSTIPSSVSKLQSLVRFEAGYCDLKSIPESFRELSSLNILHLEHNKFSKLPLSSALLSPLAELVLCECTELIELPILPEGLVKLDIEGCTKLKTLPKMAHLKRMQMLRFARCSDVFQRKISWEIRSLTAVQITFGYESGETLMITGPDSWNERFREELEGMFLVEDLKRHLEAFIKVVEVFIEKQNRFEAEHLEDMKRVAKIWKAEGSEAELLEDLNLMVESGKEEGFKAEHLKDFKRMVGSWENFRGFRNAALSCCENLRTSLERFKGHMVNLTEEVQGLEEQIESLRWTKKPLEIFLVKLERCKQIIEFYFFLRWYREDMELQKDYLECFKEYREWCIEYTKWLQKNKICFKEKANDGNKFLQDLMMYLES